MLNKFLFSSFGKSLKRSSIIHNHHRALTYQLASTKSSKDVIFIASGIMCMLGSTYLYTHKHNQMAIAESFDESLASSQLLDDIYTMEDVSNHSSIESPWIVIDNIVYDISSLVDNHPGGKGILESFAGKDVSKEFYTLQHSNIALRMKDALAIGQIAPQNNDTNTNTNKDKKRIVIIGGGICGISASYFLSNELKNENCDITVLEQQNFIGGTGLKCSAIMWLGPLLETETQKDNKSKTKMSLTQWLGEEAYNFFKYIESNWEDIEFIDRSTIGLIETNEELATAQTLFGSSGRIAGAQIITDPSHMIEIEPLIDPNQLVGIVFHKRGATVDPYLVCNAFASRAQKKGVLYKFNHNVLSLREVNNEYIIQCGNGEIISCDILVLCTGYKCNQHAKLLGYNVPVKPMHGQMFALSVGKDFELSNNIYGLEGVTYWRKNKGKSKSTRENIPPYKRVTSHLYGVQLSNGVLKFGGDRIQTDLNSFVLQDGIDENYKTVTRLFPQLKNESIVGSWGGTMPFTPDQKIICGELNTSLYVLTGSGFMRGLASGKLLAYSIIKRHYNKHNIHNIDVVNQYLKQCDPLRFDQ
eukprot:113888_1